MPGKLEQSLNAAEDISVSDRAESRIVREEGLDARVASVVAPVIEDLGYRLVRVRMIQHNGLTMQIMAERPDGSISVNDCESISRALSPVLDVEDPVAQAYNLEVSSPGIDRPLVRESDFSTWAGHIAKVETAYLVNGRKRFRGHLIEVDGDEVVVRHDGDSKGVDPNARIPLHAISSAHLVLTDDLIREALKRDKSLRQANELEEESPEAGGADN